MMICSRHYRTTLAGGAFFDPGPLTFSRLSGPTQRPAGAAVHAVRRVCRLVRRGYRGVSAQPAVRAAVGAYGYLASGRFVAVRKIGFSWVRLPSRAATSLGWCRPRSKQALAAAASAAAFLVHTRTTQPPAIKSWLADGRDERDPPRKNGRWWNPEHADAHELRRAARGRIAQALGNVAAALETGIDVPREHAGTVRSLRAPEKRATTIRERAARLTRCETGAAAIHRHTGAPAVVEEHGPKHRGKRGAVIDEKRCGQPSCPRCASTVSSRMRRELECAVGDPLASVGDVRVPRWRRWLLLTLTQPHAPNVPLQTTFDTLHDALRRLFAGRVWRRSVRAWHSRVETHLNDWRHREKTLADARSRLHRDWLRVDPGNLDACAALLARTRSIDELEDRYRVDDANGTWWWHTHAHVLLEVSDEHWVYGTRTPVRRGRPSIEGRGRGHRWTSARRSQAGFRAWWEQRHLIALWRQFVPGAADGAANVQLPGRRRDGSECDPERVLREVAKYTTKPASVRYWSGPRLQEWAWWSVLERRRLTIRGGDWYGASARRGQETRARRAERAEDDQSRQQEAQRAFEDRHLRRQWGAEADVIGAQHDHERAAVRGREVAARVVRSSGEIPEVQRPLPAQTVDAITGEPLRVDDLVWSDSRDSLRLARRANAWRAHVRTVAHQSGRRKT